MAEELFDQKLQTMRRDRALRRGPELFLYERAFEDILDRLRLVRRRFGPALLIGSLDPGWRERLLGLAESVRVIESLSEHGSDLEPGSYDLCVTLGTLDTANDLPRALLTVRFALRPDSLFIGALAGGQNLPRLRSAMRAADEVTGAASPHVHPRIEPSALTGLLSSAGFDMPVVDVDRVQVGYKSLWHLVRDLRAMGATNVLRARSRKALSRRAAAAAAERFREGSSGERVVETFELLHFAAWTPPAAADRDDG